VLGEGLYVGVIAGGDAATGLDVATGVPGLGLPTTAPGNGMGVESPAPWSCEGSGTGEDTSVLSAVVVAVLS
jgi:hypothetical protein